jgi:hypothetical protein
MTLHLSQIFFTLARTFMLLCSSFSNRTGPMASRYSMFLQLSRLYL